MATEVAWTDRANPFTGYRLLPSEETFTMTHNEAGWDRGLRVVLGLGLLSLTVIGPHTLWGLVGFVPVATGFWGFCPLYRLVGLGTRPGLR